MKNLKKISEINKNKMTKNRQNPWDCNTHTHTHTHIVF